MSLDKTKTKTNGRSPEGLSLSEKEAVKSSIEDLQNILVYCCMSVDIDIQFKILKAISLLKEVKGE